MLFSCLLLPRVPINNPSCSETAQLSLRGESWVLTVIFFCRSSRAPSLSCLVRARSPHPKTALWDSGFSSDVGSGLRGAPAVSRAAPGSRGSWARASLLAPSPLYRRVADARDASNGATLVSVPASLGQMPATNKV